MSTDTPIVNALSQQDIIEGKDLSVACTATHGNPRATLFFWTKIDNPGFKQSGATLQLHNQNINKDILIYYKIPYL